MASTKPVAMAISCHAFNKDGSMIALSPNSSEVVIYSTEKTEDSEKWVSKYILTEHGGSVSGIDWCHETNRIVTCGHDRNAYVWTYEAKSDVWEPQLVVLRINRAATSVKWSPLGNKFAVTSGAKCVPICRYEKSSNWWISKMLKKHKSTVLSCAWCPNNKFLITGSSDNKCRIFSAYIKKLDSAEEDGFGALWPEQHHFGEVLAEFDQAKSWVHSVAWAPSGLRVAFAGHGANVSFVQLVVGAAPIVSTVQSPDLPFLAIDFLSDDSLVAAGYNCNPTLYTATGDAANPKWSLNTLLDKQGKGDEKAAPGRTTTAFAGARAMWAGATDRGHAAGAAAGTAKETTLLTRHQNTITSLWKNAPGVITTAGVDGRVLYWDLAKLGVDVKGLKIVS